MQRFDCLLQVFFRWWVDWLWHGFHIMVVCCNWCISIWLLLPCTMVSSGVRWFLVRRWFPCFLFVGIHASGISAPLSLFMLFGLSLMWNASFTFLVYQWLSWSISFLSFHSGLCPIPLASSETAEFWVSASRISLSCSRQNSAPCRPWIAVLHGIRQKCLDSNPGQVI